MFNIGNYHIRARGEYPLVPDNLSPLKKETTPIINNVREVNNSQGDRKQKASTQGAVKENKGTPGV